MLIRILTIALILSLAYSVIPDGDLIVKVPGYGDNFTTPVYSGYLDVKGANRKIHYVYVVSKNGPKNKDPVTLWLNGGPGCSSMLGFLQEIGPYYLEEGKNYTKGDNLTYNPYSWHQVSNLLFFESPTGVGYSYNNETGFEYNDQSTATDNMNALVDFFKKFSDYNSNGFWIAGESYAGKYIPDLAVEIDKYNEQSGKELTINLKGILVGNGVMDFTDSSLHESSVEYMIDHNFVDPDTLHYWGHSCKTDPLSAGCGFFHKRFKEDTNELNPYNVYGYCYYNDSFDATKEYLLGKERPQVFETQASLLAKNLAKALGKTTDGISNITNAAPCSYFDGLYDYFNQNEQAYHAAWSGQKWNGPCVKIGYTINPSGSLQEYRTLLARSHKSYQIVLYNGDWDDVVPYHDTIKNLKQKLGLHESAPYQPWFTNKQHSGFMQLFNGLTFVTFKGASHQVPQSKRAEALEFFTNVLEGHKDYQRYDIVE